MENKMELIEKITAHLKGKLNPQEDSDIRKLIETDEEVKSLFDETKIIEENVRLHYWQKDAERIIKSRPKIGLHWSKISLAASVLIISSFLYLGLNKSFLNDLLMETSSEIRGEATPMASDQEKYERAHEDFLLGKASYHEMDYPSAIRLFEKALKTNNLRDQFKEALLWHLCVSYLQNNDVAGAERYLKEYETIKNPKYEVNIVDRYKVKFQIFLKKLF